MLGSTSVLSVSGRRIDNELAAVCSAAGVALGCVLAVEYWGGEATGGGTVEVPETLSRPETDGVAQRRGRKWTKSWHLDSVIRASRRRGRRTLAWAVSRTRWGTASERQGDVLLLARARACTLPPRAIVMVTGGPGSCGTCG